jgi:predicted Zn-dependent protease
METYTGHDIQKSPAISRRQFLQLSALTSFGIIVGCAANPVTGERQFMLVSETWEIQVDQQNSPHQFSSDYGTIQDDALNRYVQKVGAAMVPNTHRPQMPYTFRVLNANYINAYTFPGGSVGITRGILLSLASEAELSALIGHELGHVNARHAALQQSKGVLTQSVVGGLSVYLGTKSEAYGNIAAQLGMLGAGALLARYSRDNEREADRLGMEYMVKSGYGTDGFVALMAMLNSLNKGGASAVSLLFATHPMSQERYNTALSLAGSAEYSNAKSLPIYRDRYMDQTASLRKIKTAIELFEKGESAVSQENYSDAETALTQGLKQAPNDYAGLVIMAKCKMAREKYDDALRYSEKAKQVYPLEAQANHLSGFSKIKQKKFEAAVADFTAYEKKLPGNPNTLFYRGYAYEGMDEKNNAATDYANYLQQVTDGDQAEYAYNRLVQWGIIKTSSE